MAIGPENSGKVRLLPACEVGAPCHLKAVSAGMTQGFTVLHV